MAKAGTGEGHLAAGAAGTGIGGTEVAAQYDFVNGISMFSGNGAPGILVNGKAPELGDFYLRRDGGVGTTIYRCTVVGPPPTWAAIL